jgi:hypothetical protein
MGEDHKGAWREYSTGMWVMAGSDASMLKMDESFEGWGGEDGAFHEQIIKHFNVVRVRDWGLVHPWHPKHCVLGSFVNKDQLGNCVKSSLKQEGGTLGVYLQSQLLKNKTTPDTASTNATASNMSIRREERTEEATSSGAKTSQTSHVNTKKRFGEKYAEMYGILKEISTRFYVYDDEAIDQPGSHTDRSTEIDYSNLAPDAETDMLIINALKAHPLRTKDPQNADLFVVPLSTIAVKAQLKNETLENKVYEKAFGNLLASPWFQENNGNRHVIVSTWFGHFEHRVNAYKKFLHDPMNQYYDQIWNVTLAGAKDRSGIEKLYQHKTHPDFQDWFKWERFQMTRSFFSLGNIPMPGLPLIEPTFDKFMNSQYFIFYRIRPTKYWTPNSTEFRRAPLQQAVLDALPDSSIGYDLEKDEWLRHFSSSKFCLVVRGDDPKSHALLRAVKVGCIPVVISDAYPDYAPTLKSSINMHDYSIFIQESDFKKDPAKALQKLGELSEKDIKDKLLSLAWAQHVILPDHPESLFVPAFHC